MRKYRTVTIDLNWKDLLLRIESDNVILMNQSGEDFILAWNSLEQLIIPPNRYSADTIQLFLNKYKGDFVFGHLSYDIKNDETRNEQNRTNSDTNDVMLTVPEHIIIKKNGTLLYFGSTSTEELEAMIREVVNRPVIEHVSQPIDLLESTPEKAYLKNVDRIKSRIQDGLIYEMNYCVQFKNSFEEFNPEQTYIELFQNSEAPFSSFIRNRHDYILSASPERFISKKRNTLISQPIKGTAKRGRNDSLDKSIIEQLTKDPKEISENVMIVDLVRNDLSKIAKKKSVEVSELCKVYSFKTVHQLISTISCEIKDGTDFSEIIQALFPMGSMTGAPKISAIKNISDFETFNRGIYSGSIGYIEPNGNFDFNVVIRTIIANIDKKEIFCNVGGAITIQSDPKGEYEECKLKLNAIQKTLC